MLGTLLFYNRQLTITHWKIEDQLHTSFKASCLYALLSVTTATTMFMKMQS